MSIRLRILSACPAMTLQDLGREGYLGVGLSRGGAVDRLALFEAAALLGSAKVLPAIEMAGSGGSFTADGPVRFAITGARMEATIDGQRVPGNTSQLLKPGETLSIGRAEQGTIGYLAFAGGILAPQWLGSVSVHHAAGIGTNLTAGAELVLGADPDPGASRQVLEIDDRLSGGVVRIMPSAQSDLFSAAMVERFCATAFKKSHHANRQGARLEFEGKPFVSEKASGLVSDFVGPGDIQMAGDGVPFVLSAECQTMGGYPRIARILPEDLGIVAQASPGAPLAFRMISIEEADAMYRSDADRLRDARTSVRPMTRNPADISDLLSYQLISGVTSGSEDGEN